MKRPDQHQIDTAARRHFASTLPRNWVYREQTEDYGIDAELEIFGEDQNSTGAIFKLQIKGTESPQTLSDNSTISFSFEVNRAQYLLEQIEIPTAIILCDVTLNKVYWTGLHANVQLIQAYQEARKKKQDSFTIHFSTAKTFPESIREFLREMERSSQEITLKAAANISAQDYLKHMDHVGDIDAEMYHLKEKIDLTKAERLQRLVQQGNFDKADLFIAEILQSSESSGKLKFSAITMREPIFAWHQKLRNKSERLKRTGIEFAFTQAKDLQDLKPEVDQPLRYMADGYLLGAEILLLSESDTDLFHNWTINTPSEEGELAGNYLWIQALIPQRNAVARELVKKITEAGQLLNTLIENGMLNIIPTVALKILGGMPFFIHRLKGEGLSAAAQHYEKWYLSVLELAESVLDRIGDTSITDIFYPKLVGTRIMLLRDNQQVPAAREYVHRVLAKLSSAELRKEESERYSKFIEELSTSDERFDPENPQWEIIQTAMKDQARQVLGIDIDSEATGDELNRTLHAIIRTGIEDLNPTESMKYCQHLHFELSAGIGIPAQAIGLYSARRKMVACIQHLEFGGLEAISLRQAIERFRDEHCTNCPDRMAHSSDWIFNPPWHEKQSQQFRERKKDHSVP
jgi:hypothetical protein